MDTLDAIRQRRSIRQFTSEAIPDEVLMRLLEAMRLAPSGKNCQPWRFVVVRDKTVKSQVAAACQWRTAKGRLITQRWIDDAPVIIVGCAVEREAALRYCKDGDAYTANWDELAPEDRPSDYESIVDVDLAIALDHLVLAATAEGIGTCWIGGLNEQKLKAVLGIPDDIRAPLAIVLGYPVSWPDPRPRKALDEIVSYDRFGW
jgi:nitroreductase